MRQAARIAFLSVVLLRMLGQEQEGLVKFAVTTNLVVVNVTVRDRDGKGLRGLKKEDFRVFEDGRPQVVSVFEFQELGLEPLPPLPPPEPKEPGETQPEPPTEVKREQPPPASEVRFKDRRLMVMYFDFSSMPVQDQIRAQEAALQFLDRQMTASDLVSIVTFSNRLRTVVDFTDEREALAEAIRAFRIGEASELAAELDPEQAAEDDPDAFLLDDAEFNIFNTDRKLAALERAAKDLGRLPEKKALVYFSSGVGKTGAENQSQIEATVNAARKSNVVFYPIDTRGLEPRPPGGDASQVAPKGTDLFSGKHQTRLREKAFTQQETLYTLAADTGGKALLDSNDLTLGLQQAQKDVASYYILGYYSTNPAPDGRFRKIRVELADAKRAKLEYRDGYYAVKLFPALTAAERESQLEEALRLGNPITGLPLAAEIDFFRLNDERYFVPVSLKLPGSRIPLSKKGASESADLDFAGVVLNDKGRSAASVRDTIRVKLSTTEAGRLARRSILYDTGFVVGAGNYRVKFVVRENLTGKIGTFETRFSVPDLSESEPGVRMSSVILSAQREPLSAAIGTAGESKKILALNPLVKDGSKLVPSVTRVFRREQQLHVFFEVYRAGGEARVTAKVGIYRGNKLVAESAPARAAAARPARNGAIPFEFTIPLTSFTYGDYVCQVSVIDSTQHAFHFVRNLIHVAPSAALGKTASH